MSKIATKQLVDKSALVAEIERRKTNIIEYCLQEEHDARFDVVPEQLSHILSFLDTFEVKEVDLEDGVDKILEANDWNFDKIDFYQFAKYFFELGLKAQKGE